MPDLKKVIVCGWVRCGNRWLARLLAYYGDEAESMNVSQFYREHYWFGYVDVRYFGEDVRISVGPHEPDPHHWVDGEHLVHIFRDPRDAFVSWHQYLIRTQNKVLTGERKTWKGYLAWLVEQKPHDLREYVTQWLAAKQEALPHISWTTHEEMFVDRSAGLLRLMGEMGYPQDEARAVRAAQLSEREPRRTSYLDPEQKILRGMPGGWRHWFDAEDARLIEWHYGDLIEQLGYGGDPDWERLIQ